LFVDPAVADRRVLGAVWGAKTRFARREILDLQAERKFWHPTRDLRRTLAPLGGRVAVGVLGQSEAC
jgi:hypothetical protein